MAQGKKYALHVSLCDCPNEPQKNGYAFRILALRYFLRKFACEIFIIFQLLAQSRDRTNLTIQTGQTSQTCLSVRYTLY